MVCNIFKKNVLFTNEEVLIHYTCKCLPVLMSFSLVSSGNVELDADRSTTMRTLVPLFRKTSCDTRDKPCLTETVHTKHEGTYLKEGALFLRLGLLSAPIRQENGALHKRTSNRKNFKNAGYSFLCGRETF